METEGDSERERETREKKAAKNIGRNKGEIENIEEKKSAKYWKTSISTKIHDV